MTLACVRAAGVGCQADQMPAAPLRRAGTADVVALGLAATMSTGVFVVFTPSAAAAGGWLLVAVLVAGLVAVCNAFSGMRLARRCPGADAGYQHCQELLGRCGGRLAGVTFVASRVTAASAAGGVFARYVLPSHPLCVAVPVIVVVGVLTAAGVGWTSRGARVFVAVLLGALVVVVVVGLAGHSAAGELPMINSALRPPDRVSVWGVGTAAAVVFFAFTGSALGAVAFDFARVPRAALVRAVLATLLVTLVGYLAVGAALLRALGLTGLVTEPTPLVAAVGGDSVSWLGVVVRTVAAAATVSALLMVLGTAGATASAMARRGDLPSWAARMGARGTPWRAELAATGLAGLAAVLAGPVASVMVSACCGLLHHTLVNLAALRLPAPPLHWPVWPSMLGVPLCLTLAGLLPGIQLWVSVAVVALGTALSTVVARRGGARRSALRVAWPR